VQQKLSLSNFLFWVT